MFLDPLRADLVEEIAVDSGYSAFFEFVFAFRYSGVSFVLRQVPKTKRKRRFPGHKRPKEEENEEQEGTGPLSSALLPQLPRPAHALAHLQIIVFCSIKGTQCWAGQRVPPAPFRRKEQGSGRRTRGAPRDGRQTHGCLCA